MGPTWGIWSKDPVVPLGAGRGLIGLAFLLSANPVHAQSSDSPAPAGSRPAHNIPAAVEATAIYRHRDFALFDPGSALDMLLQVPGFTIEQPEQSRGLPRSPNVLVNGRRPILKSESIQSTLSRILAVDVDRIEIVDGATLGIPGLSGQVANVLLKARTIGGRFEWRPEFGRHQRRTDLLSGELSASGSFGPIYYTIGLSNESDRRGASGIKLLKTGSGAFLDHREEVVSSSKDNPRFSASGKYEGANDSIVNANISYWQLWSVTEEVSDRSGPDRVDRIRHASDSQKGYGWEIGGDYETRLGGGRLKMLGLSTFEKAPTDAVVITYFADDGPAIGKRFSRAGDENEMIIRGEFRWKRGSEDWEVSAEAGQSALTNVAELYDIIEADQLIVPLEGSSGKISEQRVEMLITVARPLSGAIDLKASVGGEYSRLHQEVGQRGSRTFYRPKGSLSLAWEASERLTVIAKVARVVGQLSFYDFLSSEHVRSGNIDAGNPKLVPPVSWDLEFEAVQDFERYGMATLRAYTRAIEDVHDQVPLGSGLEGTGNVSRASVFGIALTGTLKLDHLGLRGAKFDADMRFQHSELRDPLTLRHRQIGNELIRHMKFSFRHDVTGGNWAWGTDLSVSRRSPTYRMSSMFRSFESPGAAAIFLERKNLMGLKVRLTIRNLLGADEHSRRTFYSGWRDAPVARVETSVRSTGGVYALSISGDF